MIRKARGEDLATMYNLAARFPFSLLLTIEKLAYPIYVFSGRAIVITPSKDSKPIGFIVIGFNNALGHLVVAEHSRGQGVASVLLEGAEDYLKQSGASKAVLYPREGLKGFYIHKGYKQVSPAKMIKLLGG